MYTLLLTQNIESVQIKLHNRYKEKNTCLTINYKWNGRNLAVQMEVFKSSLVFSWSIPGSAPTLRVPNESS